MLRFDNSLHGGDRSFSLAGQTLPNDGQRFDDAAILQVLTCWQMEGNNPGGGNQTGATTDNTNQRPQAPGNGQPANPLAGLNDRELANLYWIASDDRTTQAAAMFGMAGWLRSLRSLLGTRQYGPAPDLVPHINDARFTVPMGGEITLRHFLGEVSFHDGPSTGASGESVVLRRTESGWLVRSVGEGFYHRAAGANEFTLVRPGSTIVLGANDAIRLGPAADNRVLTFRAEAAAAPAAVGDLRMRVRTDGMLRSVEIAGPNQTTDRVNLICAQGWAQAVGPTGSHESPNKVHINVQNAADLARLQPAVIQALQNDPVLRRLVTGWKTMDPCHALNESARAYGAAPTGQGQNAKGFTIYCASAEDAFLIQERISQILAERGLGLTAPLATGNSDSLDRRTNRVGVVRDTWPITEDNSGRQGYLLDAELSRRIHQRFNIADGQFVSAEQRRQLERDLGLRPNTVTYDRHGKLMLRATSTRSLEYHGGAYADESRAASPEGLADRRALYALYQHFELNPAQLARANGDRSAARPSGVSAENLPREFTQIADRLSTDPFLRNTALSDFQRRMETLEQQLRGISDPTARATAVQASFRDMIRDMAPSLGTSVVGRMAGINVVAAPELDVAGAPQARHVLRNRDGTVINPLYVDGNDMVTQITDRYGRPAQRRVPLSEITLELQVPASSLSANLTTEAGAAQFRNMLATVYEQLDRTHRFGTLSRAESANPLTAGSIATTGNIIADFLKRELAASADPFTRRSADYTGMSQAQLNAAAETMVGAFSGRAVRTGLMSDAALQYFVGQFRSRSGEIFTQIGAAGRAQEIQRMVREMVARPGMQIGIDPSRIIIESSPTAGGSGQQLIRHPGGEGQPAVEGVLVARRGNNVEIRTASGEVVSRPVSEVSLVIRLPEAQLTHATAATGTGATAFSSAQANEVASTVYRFLAQTDAVLNGRMPADTSARDVARASELAARRMEYELNARRLTPSHNLAPVQLAQVDVGRVTSSTQPRGAIHATMENGVVRYELVDGTTRRALTEEERERVERQLREHFERVYDASIRALERQSNDPNASEADKAQAQLALDAVRADLTLYRNSPHRRAEVHCIVPRTTGNTGWRQHLGTGGRVMSAGVVILILAETARSMLQQPGNGGGLPVTPVR